MGDGRIKRNATGGARDRLARLGGVRSMREVIGRAVAMPVSPTGSIDSRSTAALSRSLLSETLYVDALNAEPWPRSSGCDVGAAACMPIVASINAAIIRIIRARGAAPVMGLNLCMGGGIVIPGDLGIG